jgi:hypothetical protein
MDPPPVLTEIERMVVPELDGFMKAQVKRCEGPLGELAAAQRIGIARTFAALAPPIALPSKADMEAMKLSELQQLAFLAGMVDTDLDGALDASGLKKRKNALIALLLRPGRPGPLQKLSDERGCVAWQHVRDVVRPLVTVRAARRRLSGVSVSL